MTHWLDKGDTRITGLLKTTDGRDFYGIVAVNSVLRTQTDIADYLLQVNKECFIKAGDAMVHDGKKFMLGDGVTEFSGGPLFRSFRMITVTTELAWSRGQTANEPISGLPKSTTPESLGTALVCMEATSNISDVFHVSTSKFMLITNSPVQVNDRMGNYQITFVETRHGLQYAEAR